MSFINKSVNYSQTNLLKTNYLSPILNNYNNYLLKTITHNNSLSQLNYYIIPNNGKKFYLYVNKKKTLENCKEDYNILYFFPYISSDDTTDFYIEIDNKFNHTFLFEGYFYKKDDKFYYLLTDILCKDDQIITCDYPLRYTLLNEIFFNTKNLSNLNDHLTIGLHPIFQNEHENMIHIFLHNFIHKQDISSIEHVYNFKKIRIDKNISDKNNSDKYIQKGKYPDVYNVYNIISGNKEGILYIKGLNESKYIKTIIKDSENKYILHCKYNSTFNKWEPMIN